MNAQPRAISALAVPSSPTPLRAVETQRSRALLVAATGGHLKQLHRLRPRLGRVADDAVWLTFDTPQSRSLLAGEEVVFMPFTGPRDYRAVAGNVVPALRLLRLEDFDAVVSTGSAIALNFLPAAAALGLEAHYIESAARSEGPSTSGQLLACTPGVRTFTQYTSWTSDRWRFAGSVFDGFDALPQPAVPLDGARVVVTLGTLRFPFPRLVAKLRELLPPTAEVLWQTGSTDPRPFGIKGHAAIPNSQMRREIREADLVIAHGGVGAALEALEAGRCPILVPRSVERGEHIDDHQLQVARELEQRGLAVTADVDALAHHHLATALGTAVIEHPDPPLLDLTAPGIRGALHRRRIRRLRRRAPRIQRLDAEV